MTESQAIIQGSDYQADRILFRAIGKAQLMEDITVEVKMISERGGGRLLGVHILGPHATELIAKRPWRGAEGHRYGSSRQRSTRIRRWRKS